LKINLCTFLFFHFYWFIPILCLWLWDLRVNSFFFHCLFKLIFFYPSTLSCSMIDLHLGIMIGLEILHLDLSGLESRFFDIFLIIFFLNFHLSIFYLLEIEIYFFFFSFLFLWSYYVFIWFNRNWSSKIFSCVSFYNIISILCSWSWSLQINRV
jgi:hypothetical protein